jgi:hypothetical protein
VNELEVHFRILERMYLSAPINKELYRGIDITVSYEKAEFTLEIKSKFFHAANSIHGSDKHYNPFLIHNDKIGSSAPFEQVNNQDRMLWD